MTTNHASKLKPSNYKLHSTQKMHSFLCIVVYLMILVFVPAVHGGGTRNLPPEMLSEIADFASFRSLCRLSLSTRTLNDAAERPLKEHFDLDLKTQESWDRFVQMLNPDAPAMAFALEVHNTFPFKDLDGVQHFESYTLIMDLNWSPDMYAKLSALELKDSMHKFCQETAQGEFPFTFKATNLKITFSKDVDAKIKQYFPYEFYPEVIYGMQILRERNKDRPAAIRYQFKMPEAGPGLNWSVRIGYDESEKDCGDILFPLASRINIKCVS